MLARRVLLIKALSLSFILERFIHFTMIRLIEGSVHVSWLVLFLHYAGIHIKSACRLFMPKLCVLNVFYIIR